MSLNISTNTAALKAGSYLAQNSLKLQKAYDRLASGLKLSSPMDNPGGLAVSMKLQAAINRLGGAQNNVQNALSFLEVQDGMLDSVGKIVDRMSELKGLASQDPMKSDQRPGKLQQRVQGFTGSTLRHLSDEIQWSQLVCKACISRQWHDRNEWRSPIWW